LDIFKIGCSELFPPGLASNHDPSDLCLLTNWDYRHKPPVPSLVYIPSINFTIFLHFVWCWFCGAGDWTEGLVHARQLLHHVSHPQPCLLWLFRKGLEFFPEAGCLSKWFACLKVCLSFSHICLIV
jgi:hypothetical protein